jgi:hypothetical protein
MAKLRFMGMTVTNQHCIDEEIKGKLNLRNACYCFVQVGLSSHLLAKSIKIEISETVISHLSVLRQKPAQLGLIDRGRIYNYLMTSVYKISYF